MTSYQVAGAVLQFSVNILLAWACIQLRAELGKLKLKVENK
jgi:hypothetical protein